ncbi:MAG TPA: alpha/beta hydrolase [Thermoanaerobaculia bacterium]|nr:alpha/beta hydrolase [Thermoanaerobaculia bacterium]
MNRRLLVATAAALWLLSACATTRPFVSNRISIETRGAGPDLILIPGLTGGPEVWRDASETLDDRYRLHLVHVNGFAGAPPGANAEGTVSAPVAEEIARYIREAKLERPAVVGHSMGGTIGLMLAARHPELVGRLMVVDMTPFMGDLFGPEGATPEGRQRIADQSRANILRKPLEEGFIGEMFRTMTLRPEMQPELLRDVRASDSRTVANAFHELLVLDLRPELSRISAPVTVLYVQSPQAQGTPAQFDASMKALYANVPNVRLVRIDGSRHFIHWDQPQRFLHEVDAMMR